MLIKEFYKLGGGIDEEINHWLSKHKDIEIINVEYLMTSVNHELFLSATQVFIVYKKTTKEV